MKVLSSKQVTQKCSISRTTIWRLEALGQFPKRIKLSSRRVGWREDEIDEWISKSNVDFTLSKKSRLKES